MASITPMKRQSTAQNKGEVRLNIKPTTFSILLGLLGFLAYGAISSYGLTLPKADARNVFDFKINFLIALVEVGKLASGVVVSSGFIGLLLEITTLKNTLVEAIHGMFDLNVDLKYFSTDSLEKFHRRITIHKNKLKISADELINTIYSLEQYLNGLLKKHYVEEDITSFHVSPNDVKNLFVKRVERKLIIVNNFKDENKIILEFKIVKDDTINNCEDASKKFKFIKLIIGKDDLTSEADKFITASKNINKTTQAKYPYIVTFSKNIDKRIKSTTVEMEYEYEVPFSDFIQTFKLQKPCKKFTHKIFLEGNNTNNWHLQATGFASFYYSGSEIEKSFDVCNHNSLNAEIVFNNWTLPGSGYTVAFTRSVE